MFDITVNLSRFPFIRVTLFDGRGVGDGESDSGLTVEGVGFIPVVTVQLNHKIMLKCMRIKC